MVNNKSSSGFVNLFNLSGIENIINDVAIKSIIPLENIDNAFTCKSLISDEEADFIIAKADEHINKPVGITGYVSEYKDGDEIGSYRGSIYNEYLAEVLFERIKASYPCNRNFIEAKNIDHDNHSSWELNSINPLFRFIKYTNGGSLVPHYDAPYIKDNKERTLVTLVIYLTSNKCGGETRFIKDPQSNISCYHRNLEDWDRFPKNSEIISKINPSKGNALIFDHRTLHDSKKILNDKKIIIRTDLIFTRKEEC